MLIVPPDRATLLKDISKSLPEIILNERQLCDLELLATGAFSPLTGFMVQSDYASVLDRMRLQNDRLWPIPICLDVSGTKASVLEAGQSVALRDSEGFLIAVLHIEDIWQADRDREADAVYGTRHESHPGVHYLYRHTGPYYIGGALEVVNLPVHFDFQDIRLNPEEVGASARKLGWRHTAAFFARNVIHRPHFELIVRGMKQTGANLLLMANTGIAKPGDFDHYTRIRCCREVVRHLPPGSCLLNLLPLSIRMAGPREAILHTIVAKNHGCTHFIMGHDHASPGCGGDGSPFYDARGTKRILEKACGEIGIELAAFEEIVYLPFEDEFRPSNEVTEGTQTISLTGTDIRNRFRSGRKIPDWATFPEVIRELEKTYPPPGKQGFTVFFTGLSGAGKSTIAKVLFSRLLEIGERPITLLDGDIVRRNLSQELSFSKEHRDINVRRIGFVASEITKNRGIAICAPIAPYASTRREIRNTIEANGGFIEVHVSTPIEECEKRDRKGMYAKARAGLIKGYTGVDDPYEVPQNPEIRIDTSSITPDEAAKEVLLFLSQKGYI